jgi:hypothetical protein
MYRGVIVLIPVSEACLNFAQPFFLSFFLSFFDVMEGFKNLKLEDLGICFQRCPMLCNGFFFTPLK